MITQLLRWPKLFDGWVVTDDGEEARDDFSKGNGYGVGPDYEFGVGVEFGSEGGGYGHGPGDSHGDGMGTA